MEFISEFKADKNCWFSEALGKPKKNGSNSFSKLENFKILIAPHDLKRVQNLKQIFPRAILYSN